MKANQDNFDEAWDELIHLERSFYDEGKRLGQQDAEINVS